MYLLSVSPDAGKALPMVHIARESFFSTGDVQTVYNKRCPVTVGRGTQLSINDSSTKSLSKATSHICCIF